MNQGDRIAAQDARTSSAMPAIRAAIEPLDWESAFFNQACGKLNFSSSAPVLTVEALQRYTLTQAKIAADNLALADALAAIGFRLAEGEVDLCLSLSERPATSALPSLRVAGRADIPMLRQTAAQLFSLSRFRSPWYQPTDSARFYAQWVENAVLGTFDDLCLIIENHAGQPQGWVTIRRLDDTQARIGLLGVLPNLAHRGAGGQLMAAAERWCRRQGISHLRVATQIGNVAALRLYLRRGARIESTAYWLYRCSHDSV